MSKFEIEKRLCGELGLEDFHLNTGGKNITFSEEEYQELKTTIQEIYIKQIEKRK